MCGGFAKTQTCEDYLAYSADEGDHDIEYDPEPIDRYNVALGTKVCCSQHAMCNNISILRLGLYTGMVG